VKKEPTNATINIRGTEITVIRRQDEDYISLTDMVRNFDGGPAFIEQWLNNPGFKTLEFEGTKNEAGRSSFYVSAKKWADATGARGLIANAGRYGGTFAHRDIAFEFASWLSPEFKLYLIKEFQRLKEDENRRLSLVWNLNRTLASSMWNQDWFTEADYDADEWDRFPAGAGFPVPQWRDSADWGWIQHMHASLNATCSALS
jgi:hypothetical protein